MTRDKKIIAIWAQTENGVIGNNQTMPWHLPAELRHFKETTMGQVLLMGRVTFDGMKRRILPGRETLILSRDKTFAAEGIKAFTSVDEVLTWFEQQDKDLYIAGGSAVYEAFDGLYDRLVQTVIHAEIEGDTFFPPLADDQFTLVSEKKHEKDGDNAYDFTIRVLEKEKKN